MKPFFVSFFLAFCFLELRAQFTLDEMKSIELGKKFTDIERVISDRLGNVSVFEGDTLNTFKIESPESDSVWLVKKARPTLDGYGNCRYSFKFAKDVLVGIDIRFEFLANEEDKEQFAQLLKQISSAFSDDQDFHPLKSAGDELDIDKIMEEVNTNCDSNDDNAAYAKQVGFLGMKAWEVHKRVNNIPRHKFLTLQVQKTTIDTLPYTGCVAVIEVTITNEALIDLYNIISTMKIQYEQLSPE